MPQSNAPANQWREANGSAVAPSLTKAYLRLVDGRYRLTTTPASADAWFVKSGGRYRIIPTSAGAAKIVKNNIRYRIVGG